MHGKKATGIRGRGRWAAAGLFVIGVAAAVTSGSARTATYVNPPTAAVLAGFDRHLFPTDKLYAVTATAAGTVSPKLPGRAMAGVDVLSRFTFSGVLRISVDVASLDIGLGYTVVPRLGVKAPGYCANSGFADVFGDGSDNLLATGQLGLTDQSYSGTDANCITITNLVVSGNTITAPVPEPAAGTLPTAGFGLTGTALQRRVHHSNQGASPCA